MPSALRKGAVLAGYRYVDLGGSSGDEKVTWLPSKCCTAALFATIYTFRHRLAPPPDRGAQSAQRLCPNL